MNFSVQTVKNLLIVENTVLLIPVRLFLPFTTVIRSTSSTEILRSDGLDSTFFFLSLSEISISFQSFYHLVAVKWPSMC